MVGRQCKLEKYTKKKVDALTIRSEIIAYASPDSTFAVTKRLFDGAKKSILIGIYDFTAAHVKELVLNAMGRGVKVELMLDIDSQAERQLFDDLKRHGCDATPAPSCAGSVHYFASSHEKVIVIDGLWTLVQSGNYSNNSCPFNIQDGADPANFVPGNRDMGIAIESKELADFFTRILKSDIALERAGASLSEPPHAEIDTSFATAAPKKVPPLVKSKSFRLSNALKATPILSPDNYMDVIPGVLAGAKKSILIEQQYIRGAQPEVQKLLGSIRSAREATPSLDVRIILAKPLGNQADVAKGLKEIADLKQFGLVVGKNIRLLNPNEYVHCHNKLILIDGETVLVSSQNWSDSALVKNREAGLLLKLPALTKYYGDMFEKDWASGLKRLEDAQPALIESSTMLNSGRRMVRLELGDFVEV